MRKLKFGSLAGAPGVEVLERVGSQLDTTGGRTFGGSGGSSGTETTGQPISADNSSILADSEVVTADAS
jgi:hypothetical protein